LDAVWSHSLDELMKFADVHGHCNVPTAYRVEGSTGAALGVWLAKQRQEYHKGVLLPDRAARLQQLVDDGLLKWKMNK
jgi:hypothetical protein